MMMMVKMALLIMLDGVVFAGFGLLLGNLMF